MSGFEPLTLDHVRKRIAEFDGNKGDVDADRIVRTVFQQWPTIENLSEILAKVVILNQFYGTNIRKPLRVAEHIVSPGLNIDKRLKAGDPTLVDELALVEFSDKTRQLFSFATKYCASRKGVR